MTTPSIWRPYTHIKTASPPIPIVSAEGSYLIAQDGKRYLDGISSWWVNLHGHGHPHLIRAIQEQAATLAHTLLADFIHFPAAALAERLLPLLPGKMKKIFYSDNGSTAVETALKIALQYWTNSDPQTRRTRIVSLRGSFFGETFGAMSAAGKNRFNTPFSHHLFPIDQIDPPWNGKEEEALRQLDAILNQGETACFIFEPLILGAGGMIPYSAKGLDALIKRCKQEGVLTIADEVMTGFGRTGSLFATDLLQQGPDLICLAKGLTGGTLPLGATACTEAVFNQFVSDNPAHTLFHGHSYTGNPIACSAALASLDLLEAPSCKSNRERISERHQGFLALLHNDSRFKRIEQLGTILILEYARENTPAEALLEQGIFLRPLGNVLYVMPPYCIEDEQLLQIYHGLLHAQCH